MIVTSPVTIAPSVMPSGRLLAFDVTDSTGAESPVNALTDGNEVQSITISGIPSGPGNSFALSFGGSTTAPIATTASAPYRYARWNFTVNPGQSYDFAINKRTGGGSTPAQLYEFVNDGSVLPFATATINHQTDTGTPANPAPFPDPAGLLNVQGFVVQWYTLGRRSFATATGHVRSSCGLDLVNGLNRFDCADLRIATTDGATVQRIQPNDLSGAMTVVSPGFDYGPGAGRNAQYYQAAPDTANAVEIDGLGAGVRYLVDPIAVQAALQALPSIGPGNVSVTGDGSAITPLQVRFVNNLGGKAWPLMTCTDGAVQVGSVSKGGTLPIMSVNGGPDIPLPYDWIHAYIRTPVMPGLVFALPESPPPASYLVVNHSVNRWSESAAFAGTSGWADGIGGGLTGQVLQNSGTGASVEYRFRPLGPGQFRLSATWPNDASFSSSVVYTVRSVPELVCPRVNSNGSVQLVNSGIRKIGTPSALTATILGNTGHMLGGSVVVRGVDGSGASISETLPAFTVGTAMTVAGSLAFAAVTSVQMPANTSTDVLIEVDTLPVVLGTQTVNQTAAPDGATDQGVPWHVLGTYTLVGANAGVVVTQTNGTGTRMVADAVRLERLSADTSIKIDPGDVVKLRWGAGFLTAAGGTAAAASNVTAANLTGGHFYPDLPTTTTMKIGYNVQNPQATFPAVNFCNVVNVAAGLRLYPTTGFAFGPTVNVGILFTSPTYQGEFKSTDTFGVGDWVMTWDSTSGAAVVPFATQGNITVTSTQTRKVFFTSSGGPFSYGSDLNVTFHAVSGSGSSWDYDIENLQIVPASTDLDNVPLYGPVAVSRAAHTQSSRSLGPTGSETGNGTDFSDYVQPDGVTSRSFPVRDLRVAIDAIGPYTGHAFRFTLIGGTPVQFTRTNHGLSQDQIVTLQNYDDGTYPVTVHRQDGTPQTLAINGWASPCYVVDANNFVMLIPGAGAGSVVVGTLTSPSPGSYVQMQAGGGPVSDIVEWSNAGDNDCWWNTCASSTTECMFSLGQYIGENLAAGKWLLMEALNETWNFTGPIGGFETCTIGGYAFGFSELADDPVPYTCEQMQRQATAMRAGWVAAGRSADDFKVVMGSIAANDDQTRQRALYCHAKGYHFDLLVIGDYWQNAPLSSQEEYAFAATMDRMGQDQFLDMFEWHYERGGHDKYFTSHRNLMLGLNRDGSGTVTQPEFLDTAMAVYEGGPDFLPMSGGNRYNAGYIGHAIHRHPRFWGTAQNIFRIRQDGDGTAKCERWHDFTLAQPDGGDGQNMWGVFTSNFQPMYVPGDPTQDAIQINTPQKLDLVHSVQGGAIDAWGRKFNRVLQPDYSFAVAGPVAVLRGATATLTATLTPLNGFAGTAVLGSPSGLPSGVTAGAWSPTSLTPGVAVSAHCTLAASGSATLGTSTVAVAAVDSADGLSHAASFSLTVNPADVTPPASTGGRPRKLLPMRRLW